ncbi:uncharacterized protein [Dermacentor andersoni]|uniref:uncharacterized protein isoform X1 n=1 Tax=Dermacentor andersoni TaxID=34620 RepID=UPI002155245B|nr:uncharacterized protein LOC126545088 isoform X1 [Dermacentor andersoni]
MDSTSTAVCYGLRVMMFVSKIAGCPFVNGVCGRRECKKSRLCWLISGPFGLAYSVICIALCSCVGLVYVATVLWLNGRTDQITFITRSGLYFVVYGQVVLNICNLLLRRKQLADIVVTATKLEPSLRLDMKSVRRRLQKVTLLCLLYTLIDAFKYVVGRRGQIKVAFYLFRGYGDHVKRLFVPCYIASCFLVSTWYNMVFWQIVYFSSLFREYFAALSDRLESEMANESRAESKGLSSESVRLNLVELQKLLRKVNAFVGVQALWYYCGSVFFLCAMLYYNTATSNVGVAENASNWSYVVVMAAGVVFSTAAASSMTHEASRIHSIIQASKFETLSDAATHRLHILILTVEDLQGSLTGCGMFVINLPLIVTIVGSVITYTVVLVQTSESIMSNKCSRGPVVLK